MTLKPRDVEFLNATLGDIQKYLDDTHITEVLVNSDGKLWVVGVDGKAQFTNTILSHEKCDSIIRIVANFFGTTVNDAKPIISARMPQGYRFEGVVPPVVKQSIFVIRKHAAIIFTLNDYLMQKIITEEQAAFIRSCIQDKRHIIISGATYSGKTKFANALIHEISTTNDRVVIGEDVPELQSTLENCLYLQTIEGVVTMRDLLKSMMRLHPDRIIIGEVRDGAALDLIKAWNTHLGGIATIHATSAFNALRRLEMLCQEAVQTIPRMLIGEVVDVIIHLRYDSGVRRVSEIISVKQYNSVKDSYDYDCI